MARYKWIVIGTIGEAELYEVGQADNVEVVAELIEKEFWSCIRDEYKEEVLGEFNKGDDYYVDIKEHYACCLTEIFAFIDYKMSKSDYDCEWKAFQVIVD